MNSKTRRARRGRAIVTVGLALAFGAPALFGCASTATTSYVKSDTQLGRVVVYRNGIAYFERTATVRDGKLELRVPADKVDDFLKSLTVVDAKTNKPVPIVYPTRESAEATEDGLVTMTVKLRDDNKTGPVALKLTYVTEAPAWKPSYRVVVDDDGKVSVQAWAIVDNTSGEDWERVKLGVGASSALSFRYDLRSVRLVQRETLTDFDSFAQAPPVGGTSLGGTEQQVRLLAELDDSSLKDAERVTVAKVDKKAGASRGWGGASAPAPAADSYHPGHDPAGIVALARRLQNTNERVVIEGYAQADEKNAQEASLDRANLLRDQLVRNGVDPSQVVAMGNGFDAGRKSGVRVVAAPPPKAKTTGQGQDGDAGVPSSPDALEPIGTSHFESTTPMTVERGTSAMVSIMSTQTEGEVVYLYDAESERGNDQFAFRAVRLVNPTESSLEGGPVTVFGQGRFIGEGLTEDIPSRSAAFVPFALDRQVVVADETKTRDEIQRIIKVQRGVFSTEVKHTRQKKLVLTNRLSEPATVFLRHTVAEGFELAKAPEHRERVGRAHLFRVEVPANGSKEVVIEEATPRLVSTDIRSPEGLKQVRLFVSSAANKGPLKERIEKLVQLSQEMGTIQERIDTLRAQMAEYQARMDELHAQVVTLKAVKTAGPLMRKLEGKLGEASDRLSEATISLVALQEQLMVARIQFQDSVASISLEPEKGPAPKSAGEGEAQAILSVGHRPWRG